jgi:hypothetical protein
MYVCVLYKSQLQTTSVFRSGETLLEENRESRMQFKSWALPLCSERSHYCTFQTVDLSFTLDYQWPIRKKRALRAPNINNSKKASASRPSIFAYVPTFAQTVQIFLLISHLYKHFPRLASGSAHRMEPILLLKLPNIVMLRKLSRT